MSKKKFKPIEEDVIYVEEDLLENNQDDITIERLEILGYIYKKYPEIFWEAYGASTE